MTTCCDKGDTSCYQSLTCFGDGKTYDTNLEKYGICMNDYYEDTYYSTFAYCNGAFYFSKSDQQNSSYSTYYGNQYQGTSSVSQGEVCLYYLFPSKNDGYDAVKIEVKAEDISNAYFVSKVFIYNTKTGEYSD